MRGIKEKSHFIPLIIGFLTRMEKRKNYNDSKEKQKTTNLIAAFSWELAASWEGSGSITGSIELNSDMVASQQG